jgi:HD-GYP domain-containing protein (c-di-GMP phosphodiesterase class II)
VNITDQNRDRASSTGEMGELVSAAREFVLHFGILLKQVSVHDPGNEALHKPLQLLAQSIRRMSAAAGPPECKILNENIFINGQRIRPDVEIYSQYLVVVEEMKKRGVGIIAFARDANEDALIRFLVIFAHHRADEGIGALAAALAESGLAWIDVAPEVVESRRPRAALKGHTREVAREAFFGAIYMIGGLLRDVDRQNIVNVRRARRMVQSFLDLLNLDEDYLLGLVSMKNFDDYTFNHSVNVTILALNMGRRIGLSRVQLSELGLSAIFHDLGKISLPRELITKETNLDASEWETMHRHPVEGVKKMLHLKGVSNFTIKLLISVYEHHINYDFSGYPELPLSTEASLFSRILRIVDSYDAMTSKRAYSKRAKHPVAALEEIWSLAGKHFDPDLAKVFISMMGMYPVGTVVQLDSGEIAMVTANRSKPGLVARPVLEVLTDWEDKSRPGTIIDLAGKPERAVVGYYDFRDSRIDPIWYLLNMIDQPGVARH